MSAVERRQVSTPDGNPTPISWSPACSLVTMVTELSRLHGPPVAPINLKLI